jgi:hypothetical protein
VEVACSSQAPPIASTASEILGGRGDFVGIGRGSGVKTEVTSGGTVMELSSRGKITRQEWFVEQNGWQRALSALAT